MIPEPTLHLPRPPLTDGVVALRAWRADDAAQLAAAWADPAVARWTGVPAARDEAAARRWIDGADSRLAAGIALDLAVTTAQATAAVVGEVGLVVERARRRAAVGYWVASSARGRGVATRAVRLLCDWAADELDLDVLVASVEVANPASASVLEAAGFEPAAERGGRQAWARRTHIPGRADRPGRLRP